MATFPALIPSGRTFTPGDYPHTGFAGYSGAQGRVRHGNVMLASELRLSFVGLSEANMLSILSHYQGQQGGFLSFDLPSSILSGFTPADFTLSGYSWRYAGSPEVEDFGDKLHTVTLTLASVPPEGAAVAGLARTVAVTLSAGSVSASSNVPAATWTITTSLSDGAATGGAAAAGADLTVTVALDAGAADGGV